MAAAIDELQPTYALRPLVVISIVEKVARDPGYHLQVADIADRLPGGDRLCEVPGGGTGYAR